MKVLVAGIGGIGGWLAGTLARGGADVTLYARGLTLARLREDGLRLIGSDGEERFRLPVWDGAGSPASIPDVVLICSKAQDVGAVAQGLASALAHGPAVSAVVNGLPWWFLDGLNAPLAKRDLESIDPGGRARAAFSGLKAIGAVVHASSHAVEPGVIRLNKQDRLILGDPDGGLSPAIQDLARLCEAGGLSCPVTPDIRTEIWIKLWGNMSVNPPSALTGLSTGPLHELPETLTLIKDLMREFDAVGQKLGLRLPMSIDERIEVTRFLGDFRPSMLVDAQAGRTLELDAVLGCIVELAELLGGMPIPASRAVYALAKGLNRRFELARGEDR
ncbi:MAG: ketopantoate reductase family protein [Beijerinckiaceae bacterium]